MKKVVEPNLFGYFFFYIYISDLCICFIISNNNLQHTIIHIISQLPFKAINGNKLYTNELKMYKKIIPRFQMSFDGLKVEEFSKIINLDSFNHKIKIHFLINPPIRPKESHLNKLYYD